ncbi:flagellar basal-body MS-ring/collar protein FliF [Jannaschia sp. CCS1]|uniref:flagellar basal-body MS-ring/collar protein FliF n=1 Tax=Jannaschia sp. (strain CCS1) TaxID=290400 RepID=UPI000053B7F6|nr:flagellar basal-body MS-ring/collar protein FliF [Jannaschia sp. CCS1]ABD57097.1 flagellar M-ring protein FliF [Jannaschia sp. CCS1]
MSDHIGPERLGMKGVVLNALLEIWNGMNGRRRGLLIGGIAALAVVLVILTRIASQPSFQLLYSGLDPAAAGEVVDALAARGVAHRIDGDQIFVDATQRDELRMALAGEGLPANGPQGYELLDSLSGFGTTSQMFDAAYWRAKEGELSRTILASPAIRAARVHIANPSSDPFQPTNEVTASVAIRPASGGLAPGHAHALRYLVASSVPGLRPENVTVIDADSGQVLGGQGQMTPAADAAGRATTLQQNVERLLAARVGPSNAVVQVSVELETARETILERVIDPESRVIIATDTEEMDNASTDGAAAGVTVASNLPDGDGAAGEGSSAQTTESRERVTFDMSELQREVEREPGDIRRITVAVLVNGVEEINASGVAETIPRPAAELDALTELVRSAVGYDEARGDIVTIQSMAFDAAAATELTEAGFADRLNLDVGQIVQTLLLAAVALAIAFGLLRPLLARSGGDSLNTLPPLEPTNGLPAPSDGAVSGDTSLPTTSTADVPEITMASTAPKELPPLPAVSQMGSAFDDALPMMMAGSLPGDLEQNLEDMDPVDRLRLLIQEREEETVQILRSWMNEDEEAAR